MIRAHTVAFSALALVGTCLWIATDQEAVAAAQRPIRIQVIDSPRPVSAAVLQIEKMFGSVVTYEDTRYVYPGDIVDETERVRRDLSKSTHIYGRRNSSLDFTYTPPPGPIDTQVGGMLAELIARSNGLRIAGQFLATRVSGGYHVVPTAIKGKSGTMEPFASPLDTRITLPREEQSGLEMMFAVTKAITDSSGANVKPGTMPLNRLNQKRAAVSAQGERARDVLWRVLQSMGPDLSWQLLCGVGEEGDYVLNIHIVPKR